MSDSIAKGLLVAVAIDVEHCPATPEEFAQEIVRALSRRYAGEKLLVSAAPLEGSGFVDIDDFTPHGMFVQLTKTQFAGPVNNE